MKNTIYILGLLGAFALFSCEDLDRELILEETPDLAIPPFNRAEERINGVYATLPMGFYYLRNDPSSRVEAAMLSSASDESEHTLETHPVQRYNNGSWNAADNPDNAWQISYLGIRRANDFLETTNLNTVDFSQWEPDAAYNETAANQLADRQRRVGWMRAEARFLRAFFHFELVKRYGGVPIIDRKLGIDEDYSEIQRNSLEECIDFIVSECTIAADSLPVTYTDNTFLGKATKGSVLALKSRVLLYAASDLYNDMSWASGYGHPELLTLLGNRNEKWQAAAEAAKEVIDLGVYSLASNYRNLFRTFDNPELIFVRRDAQRNDFEQTNFSIGFVGGRSGTTPSQNLVDAYEMADGTSFNWNNPAHAANPYDNRDPRLHQTILVNNAPFRNRNMQMWNGGLDGPGVERTSRTGYYLLKHVDEDANLQTVGGSSSVHTWVFFRLAEIYLNYAEALNEYEPGNPDIKNYVDMVRQRSNMPPLPVGFTQEQMRQRIRNERRVELAFEDHRIWDTRRWMIGESTLGAPLRGVQVQRIDDETFNYTPRVVEQRAWDSKMYWYPIPQSEVLRAGNWPQNPVW